MKIGYPDKTIDTVSATSENSEYPAENVLTDILAERWESDTGVSSASLTIDITAGADGLGAFGIQADSVTVTVKDSTGGGGATVNTATYTLSNGPHKQLWHEFSAQGGNHSAVLAFSVSSGVVYCGAVRAFVMANLASRNPDYGISQQPVKNNIVRKYLGGGRYVLNRTAGKAHSLDLLMNNSSDVDQFNEIYDHYGDNPAPILIADGIEDMRWAIFGAMNYAGKFHQYGKAYWKVDIEGVV